MTKTWFWSLYKRRGPRANPNKTSIKCREDRTSILAFHSTNTTESFRNGVNEQDIIDKYTGYQFRFKKATGKLCQTAKVSELDNQRQDICKQYQNAILVYMEFICYLHKKFKGD